VCELHATDLHVDAPSITLGVTDAPSPKLTPVTEISTPAVVGTFIVHWVMAGASYVMRAPSVPSVDETVTDASKARPEPGYVAHSSAVTAVHDVLLQAVSPI